MSTLQLVAAKITAGATDAMVRSVKATPADKIEWKPLDEGRSILSQVQECAVVATFFAAILRNRALPQMPEGAFESSMKALDTLDKALAALDANTADLLEAIRAFPDAHLADTITMPWGGEPLAFEEVLFLNYWNLVYHTGQTGYIQTLYGDRQMH